MKKIKKFLIINLFILPLFSSFLFILVDFSSGNSEFSIAINSDFGISHYEIKQSVTYQVEINFSAAQLTGGATWYFKVPRLNNRGPNSNLTTFCPPYQESSILYNNVTGYNPSELIFGHNDKYNNTYDSYNATLGPLQNVKLNQKYLIKLNEIQFDAIQDTDIGVYNYSDEIFQLYCNKSDVYYNRTDPNLIAASNSIVNPSDNPVEKAQKICNWVSNYLAYNTSLLDEIGASAAYGNQSGDCSEFSSLMITLLRIQDIPARKVTGFVLSNEYSFKPEIGDVYTYTTGKGDESTILGHAWVEYYVPTLGWIACDPTWYKFTGDYFNKIDFLHFNFNVGSWFFYPPNLNYSEFAFPIIYALGTGDYDYDFQFKATVLDTDYITIDFLGFLIIIIIAAVLIIAFISIIMVTRRKRSKLEYSY
ncbi:MAG: transglutaminase family protein [Candidatus Hodarchaeota archaeon]